MLRKQAIPTKLKKYKLTITIFLTYKNMKKTSIFTFLCQLTILFLIHTTTLVKQTLSASYLKSIKKYFSTMNIYLQKQMDRLRQNRIHDVLDC